MNLGNVIIVEDESLVALDLEGRINEMGYHVTSVHDNGEDALRAIGAEKPDLVVMDVQIFGDLDGIEVGRRARDEHGTRILFLTSQLDPIAAGAAGFSLNHPRVSKPFSGSDLERAMQILTHPAVSA